MSNRMNRDSLRLYVVTDRRWLFGKTLPEQIGMVVASGATCIQLREKNLDDIAFLQEAIEVRNIAHQANIPFIINDNIAICQQSEADGVHLGQQDMPVKEARALLGPDKLIGVTAKTIELAQQAQEDGADYIGAGAVFGTQTKQDAKPLDKENLIAICRAVKIPVVAIGGIGLENMTHLENTGISGVAVVSAVFAASDIVAQTKQLRRLADKLFSTS